MNHLFSGRMLLAILISVSLAACKGKDKDKEKETTSTDSTKMTQTTTTTNNADMDAVKVAPNLYKVMADSLGIRIVDVNYQPGDSSALHWHPDYAIYVAQGGEATFYAKDGSKMTNQLPTGATLIKPGEFHSVKNTGKTAIKVILFEINRSGQPATMDASMDAVKVSPDIYKVKNDTMGIRVLEITSKPGQSTVMHSHPDAGLYVIEPGTGEFTDKDGKKATMNMDKGMAGIIPAVTHSVKNVGKTTMHAILVEVNRAMK